MERKNMNMSGDQIIGVKGFYNRLGISGLEFKTANGKVHFFGGKSGRSEWTSSPSDDRQTNCRLENFSGTSGEFNLMSLTFHYACGL